MNESLRTLKVEYLPVAQLIPHARNPRTHSAKQVRQIAECMKKFGFNNPILIDPNRGVIAGHGRLLAAKLLGMSHIPTICLDQRARRRSAHTYWPTTGWHKMPVGIASC
jgi:ParB-like chromosome segregation protein Spo0J